jgi:hypothetical protein
MPWDLKRGTSQSGRDLRHCVVRRCLWIPSANQEHETSPVEHPASRAFLVVET